MNPAVSSRSTATPRTEPAVGAQHPKLLERLRQALVQEHVAPAQIEAYVGSIAAYIRFHGLRHPRELSLQHIGAFLAQLRRQAGVTPAHEASARAALGFLYNKFLPADTVSSAAAAGGATATPAGPAPTRSPFLNRCHEILRLRHYALRTEECYLQWIKRFILFHGKRHPAEMGAREIEAFLTHLAVHGQVSASTQNQAFNALVFLYRQVLEQELPPIDAVRAKRPAHLPVVMSRTEVRQVLAGIEGGDGVFKGLGFGTA